MAVDAEVGGDVSNVDEDLELLEKEDLDEEPDNDEEEEEQEETPAGGERRAPQQKTETPEEEEEEEEAEEPAGGKKGKGEEEEEPEKKEPPQHPLGGRRLSVKEIEGKFPKLFETYPELKDSFFRDSKFRRAFATPEEAQKGAEALDYFEELETSLLKGDSGLLIASLKDRDPKLLAAVARDFLPKLSQVSPSLVVSMVKPHFRSLLRNAAKDAERLGNKNLLNSVGHIAKYAEIDLEEKEQQPGRPDPEKENLKRTAEQLMGREAQRFIGVTQTHGVTQLTREIITHLGKVREFSPIEKQAIAQRIVDEVGTRLDADETHDRTMNKLFERAERAGWPEDMIPRIIDAYLGGARPLIDSVLKRHVAAAMKVKGIRRGPKEGTGVVKDVNGAAGGAPKARAAGLSAKDIDYGKSSDMDILNDRVTLRRKGA